MRRLHVARSQSPRAGARRRVSRAQADAPQRGSRSKRYSKTHAGAERLYEIFTNRQRDVLPVFAYTARGMEQLDLLPDALHDCYCDCNNCVDSSRPMAGVCPVCYMVKSTTGPDNRLVCKTHHQCHPAATPLVITRALPTNTHMTKVCENCKSGKDCTEGGCRKGNSAGQTHGSDLTVKPASASYCPHYPMLRPWQKTVHLSD